MTKVYFALSSYTFYIVYVQTVTIITDVRLKLNHFGPIIADAAPYVTLCVFG